MLELSPRGREKQHGPHAAHAGHGPHGTTVEVVSVEKADDAPTLPAIRQMLEKRLEIARVGLNQARERLNTGDEEEALILLEKVDEDLHLLRRRVRREFEKADLVDCRA